MAQTACWVAEHGFEEDAGEASWQVPDLTVITQDEPAVAWGLNRVQVERPDGQPAETWHRGTRVFRRIGDDWLMVHQHLSYPLDPQAGTERAELET